MKRTNLSISLALAGTVAALGIASVSSSGRTIAASGERELAQTSPEAAATRDAPRSRWRPGSSRTYEFATRASVTLPGTPEPIELSARGDFSATVVGAHGGRIVLRVQIAGAALTMRRPDEPRAAAAPELEEGLDRAAYVLVEPSGRIAEVDVDPAMPASARQLVSTLVAASQWVEGVGAGHDWTTHERDALGEYTARYERRGLALHKEKQRYAPAAAGPSVIAVTSTTGFELDDEDWPRRIDVDETLALASLPGAPPARLAFSASFRIRHVGHDAGALAAYVRERDRLVAIELTGAAGTDGAAGRAERDRRLVAGAELVDLIRALAELPEGATSQHQRNHLNARLAALFRLEAGAASEAFAQLDDLPAEAAATIVAALGASATPEAQALLGELLGDTAQPSARRTHGAMVLGMAEAPGPDTFAALTSAIHSDDAELHGAASLGLGTAAARAPGSDDATAAVERLLALFAAARSTEELRLALAALGNTHDARIVPAVRMGLASSASVVRAAAVDALRFVQADDVDALIDAVLIGDASPEVRRAAAATAGYRPVAPRLTQLTAVLDGEPAAGVRLTVVHVLGRALEQLPACGTPLRAAAASDTDASVRAAAAHALAGTNG